VTPKLRVETMEWLRERPAILYPLIRRFPPACTVRATKPLVCPGPGKVGIVVSYFEGGTVGVLGEDTFLGIGDVKAECNPDDLELVSCEKITQAEVAELLAEIDGPASQRQSEGK
jgi:hypothetical protein